MFDPFGAAPAVTNNDNYGPVILGVTWPLTLTALILLGLRFYSNIFITRRVKADLYIATVTHFIAVIGQLCISTAVAYGIGKHIGILPHENIDHSLKWVWIGQILFVACMALGKVAIIAFLLQIRGPHDPRLGPVLLWAIAISNLILNGMTIIFILLQCDPVAKLWDRDLPGSCPGLARNQTFAFFSGSFSSLSDMALALFPISILWKLQVQMHVKVGLCVLMGLGVIASVCAAVRTSELKTLDHQADITFYISPLTIWSSVEVWIILIVGSVPPIRPIWIRLFHSVAKVTTNGFNSRNRTHKSRVGTDTTSDKIIEIEQKEVIAPVRNQVYLSNTEGQGYGQDTKRFGSNAGAEGGARSSMPSDSWAALMAKGDQVVVTTKIDVDSRSPPTSPRVFDASKALRTMGEATITPGERPPRKHDSAGGMTFYNPRDSMA